MSRQANAAQKKKTNDKNNGSLNKGGLLASVWTRAFTAKSEWPHKDEFLDVVYWVRQVMGLVLGIMFGIIPLKGIIGLGLFCIVNAGVIYMYFSAFQKVDEEEFGGAWEITKEGFMSSFAGFLVTWIMTYSGLHFD